MSVPHITEPAADTEFCAPPAPVASADIAAPHDVDIRFAREVHSLVRDLMVPNPWIYWCDFLVSLGAGYLALAIYLTADLLTLRQTVAFLVAAFALYRVLMFIHELAHLPRGTFRGFRIAWNFLAGIPLLLPSFLYAEHRSHHVNHSYGTREDWEYVPLGRGPLHQLYLFVAQGVLMPALAVIRFAVLAPLSVFSPRFRRWVWEHASGLTQNNPHYRRPFPEKREAVIWGLQEAGCFLVCVTVGMLIWRGVLPWTVLPKLWLLFSFVMVVSYLRALAAHWYAHDGPAMSYLEQMFDTTTIPGHPLLTELWAPLGQRYHALHHLIPSIPYHSLGAAHRRLMRELPLDSPYRSTVRSGLWSTLREFASRTRKISGQTSSAPV